MPEELLNLYDERGVVIGSAPRSTARRSGRALGAVNVLLVNRRAELLLQRRRAHLENGGRWDKSVGGHVAAGESFDDAARRETAEELFDCPLAQAPLHLARGAAAFERRLRDGDPERGALLRRAGLQLNLRDVRHAPGGGLRNALYHVAVYHGRCELPLAAFSHQAAEIEALRWVAAAEVDRLLLAGELAPNMALLWLAHAAPLLALART